MGLQESSFEKLGLFYLGRILDWESSQASSQPLLYDSRDLLTHAVCIGMTGSGKTGLCLALLEEAALDSVPAIIIDPKGDLGNLLLAFPNLKPEDFLPWINEDDAKRANMEPEEFAAQQASQWRKGLASWGQSPDRIQRLVDSAQRVIYTPGSTSGVPLNLFNALRGGQKIETELLAEKAQNTAASLLALAGLSEDPVLSREAILISNVLLEGWRDGRDFDLATLATNIHRPNFNRIGLLDLETFFPERERFKLVLALNNLLASPAFAAWQEGEPLDIHSFLWTAGGKPKQAIFSIAHLEERERMFFVSLLLNELLSWTRQQTGTTSLRAIVYMDEIFGYLPPVATPPSKKPLLTLLKQARAFGVGIVLATQNPVDLDYKALSNIGTWLIGRLQTEQDRARVIEGLLSSSSPGNSDREQIKKILSGLGKRIFLMHNIHSAEPCLFESRWAMSYLRGPLTRDQIRKISRPKGDRENPPPTSKIPTAPSSASQSEIYSQAQPSTKRPTLPPGIPETFYPCNPGDLYEPFLLAKAEISFRDARLSFDSLEKINILVEIPRTAQSPRWDAGLQISSIFNDSWLPQPPDGVIFTLPPTEASISRNYQAWLKSFREWLLVTASKSVLYCQQPKCVLQPWEDPATFHARLQLLIRENRDAVLDSLRRKYASRRSALVAKVHRAETTLKREKEQASQAQLASIFGIGASIAGILLGRKKISATNITRASTASRGVSRSLKEQLDVKAAQESLNLARQELAELDAEIENLLKKETEAVPKVEKAILRPSRSSISAIDVQLAWIPKDQLQSLKNTPNPGAQPKLSHEI